MVAPLMRECDTDGSELIPVCCSCHRERIGANIWREHTPVDGERLTHGICPACMYALYPDIAPLVEAEG